MLSSIENCVQVFCLQKLFHVSNSLQSTTEKSGISLWNPLPSSVNANPVLRVHQIPWQPPYISPHFPTLMLNHNLLFGLLNTSILRCPSDSSSVADPVIWTHFLYLVLKLQTTSLLEVSIWINSRGWWENAAISPVCGETQPDSHRWRHSHCSRHTLEKSPAAYGEPPMRVHISQHYKRAETKPDD